MIECKICNKKYKRIDSVHLPKIHNISVDEYLDMFPGSDIISAESLKRYSTAQTEYAKSNPIVMKERAKKAKHSISTEDQQKSIDAMKKARESRYDEIYGSNSERNKKISIATTNRWNSYSKSEKSKITKKSAKTTRENMGDRKYLEMMADKSMKGYQSLVKNGRGSKWEEKMFQQLKTQFPDAVHEKRVGGRYFDAFIPSKNLLVEFDGDFWHPLTIEDCQYEFQERNFYNDLKKNKIAKENGYDLVRIRESNPEQLLEII